MLFNSWEFIVLLFVTTVLYFNVPYKFRALILLLSSYFFYMFWMWKFAILMLVITIINYIAGILIEKEEHEKKRKTYIWVTVLLSLSPLLFYKYANFLLDSIAMIFDVNMVENGFYLQDIILPVGISFYTFQGLSYSLDVYLKHTKAEHDFVRFSAFVAFFPQLIAGPIERSSNLLAQIREKHDFNPVYFEQGIKLFIWGLFKKVVIADRLSFYVDEVYASPESFSGLTLAVATIFFAVQIYCDFSGYSDMAIGAARIMGFKLMQNFNLPYFANSIGDFWKRWHISLSSWFGDYVYKPLGGNRVTYLKWIRNILAVFLISGLWHGAAYTFIIWGALHALYYFVENWGDTLLKKINALKIKEYYLYKKYKQISVFLLVCYAWIFFRAPTLEQALIISKRIFTDFSLDFYPGDSSVRLAIMFALLILLFVIQYLQAKGFSSLYFSKPKAHWVVNTVWYALLLIGISLLGISSNNFIYFQF